MAKTNPIGVRFDKDLYDKLILGQVVTSPQKALNLFEKTYMETLEGIFDENKEENKKVLADIMELGVSVVKIENYKLRRVDPFSEEVQIALYNATHSNSMVVSNKEKDYSNIISDIDPKQGDVVAANNDLSEGVVNETEKNRLIEEIKKVKSEKIPSERNTQLGKKVWQNEQNSKINELKEKLNNLL